MNGFGNILVHFLAHAPVHAPAGDEAHGAGVHAQALDLSNWLPGVTALLVFAIAFLILALKVWPRITQALDDRERKIREEIRSAEQAREQAKNALAQYERELAGAREEASRMIQQAKGEAKAAGEELRRRNEQELAEMRQRATREIQSAKETAIMELHAEAAGLATSIASRILQREISADDQRRLVEESLDRLSAVGR